MKSPVTTCLLLALATLALSAAPSRAQGASDPVGFHTYAPAYSFEEIKVTYLSENAAVPIAASLTDRAIRNGVTVEIPVSLDLLQPVLESMVEDLIIAADPIVAPATKAEFAAICNEVAQELIHELYSVRMFGSSAYFGDWTLWKVRDPMVNDAMVRMLVRAAM